MSRIIIFFAVFSACGMSTKPQHKKTPFSAKPYLYAWPDEHSVKFCPEMHKTPWLGLITHSSQVLILEEAAMKIVGNTQSVAEIEKARNFQKNFGAQNAIPLFIAHCAAAQKRQSIKKK